MAVRPQCYRFVESGEHRCPKPSAPGSKFCWHHYPRETLISGLVVGFVFFALPLAIQLWRERQADVKARTRAHAAIPIPIPKLNIQPNAGFGIYMGSNSFMGGGPLPIQLPQSYQVAVGPDGSVLIAGAIHNEKNALVGSLAESRLFLLPGVDYDSNWSDTALEVVDPKGRPVLQVFLDPTRTMAAVNHVTYVRDTQGGTYVNYCTPDICGNVALPLDEWPLKPIFKYPGYENQTVQARELIWPDKTPKEVTPFPPPSGPG